MTTIITKATHLFGASLFAGFLLIGCDEKVAEATLEPTVIDSVALAATACPSDDNLTTHCGFQNPEDMALMPDGQHLIVTGYGGVPPFSVPGTLYLFDLTTKEISEPLITYAKNTWGDAACTRNTDIISPHGLSLVARSDGRHELAITNHLPRETIELFEVSYDKDSTWSLTWRGCVDAAPNKAFNDVSLTREGSFYAASMFDLDLPFEDLLKAGAEGTDTGSVWHWTREEGYHELPGTEGGFPNGVDLSEDEASLYINYWFDTTVAKYNLSSEKIEFRHQSSMPDNLTVVNGDVWVATHDMTLADLPECPPELTQCLLPFTIRVLSGEDLSEKQTFSFSSKAFGVATVAIPTGDTVWLGTFHGDRVASFKR